MNRSSFKIVELLIQNNININFSEINGSCPLSEAVIRNNTEVFNLLIENGANVNLLNFQKETPLLFLAKFELLSKYYLSKFIDNNADLDIKDKDECSLLMHLSKLNKDSLVNVLLNQTIFNNTLIINLITLGKNKVKINNDSLSQIINKGYSKITIDTEDDRLNTPLIHACFEECYNVVDTLLKYGADVNKDNYTNNRPLFMAIYKNNMKICKLLLNTGKVEMNHKNNNGDSEMSLACINDNGEMIDLLVEYHSDVHNLNRSGLYPAHVASINNKLKTLKALCDHGANVNMDNIMGNKCFTLACINENKEIIEYLINNHYTDFNNINYYGDTVLHQCCTLQRSEIVKFLISHESVDIDIPNGFGYTPLLLLSKKNNTELVKYLIEVDKPIDLNAKTYGNEYALFYATYHNNLELIKILLDHNVDMYNERSYKDNLCSTSFFIACSSHGNIETMKLFIDHGIDVNRPNSVGIYPIAVACKSAKIEHVEYLLNNGANPNVQASDTTPLIEACEQANLELVKVLVSHGADVNLTNSENRSPLVTLVIDTEKRNKDIIQYLIDHGGDIYFTDNYGNCLLYLVKNTNKIDKEEVYDLLISSYKARNDYYDKNNDINVFISNYDIYHRVLAELKANPTIDTETIMQKFSQDEINRAYLEACVLGKFDMIKQLFELVPTIDINTRETNGDTPLIIACQTGKADIAMYLLDHGADPNLICECSSTAIYVASFSYSRHNSLDLMQYLLEHGAQTDLLCQYNISPLMVACKNGLGGVARLFFKHNVDPNMQDPNGNTALHITILRGHNHVFKEFIPCKTINLDIQTNKGYTPLMVACGPNGGNRYTNHEIIKQLLNDGANIYIKNEENQTAIHIACKQNFKFAIDAFFECPYKIDLLQKDKHGFNAYQLMKANGSMDYLKPFIDYEMNYLKILMKCYQCQQKSDLSENAVYYLGKEAFEQFDQTKNTHSAIIATLEKELEYIQKEKVYLETYQSMIDRFKVSDLDLKELTPEEVDILLIYSVIDMEIKLIHQLFDCKEEYPEFPLNINAQDQDGNTSLHYVCYNESEKCQYVNLPLASFFLRQPDINVNIQNKNGCTPFLFSCYKNYDDISKILLKHGVDIHIPNQYNETPLMIACRSRAHDLVETLIEHGADVNAQDTINGDTALTIISKFSYDADIIKLLVKKAHANVNVVNRKGDTPLLLTCFSNDVENVKLMVEYGADINVQESVRGYTPLMISLENFNFNLAHFFCQHHANLELVNHQGDTALLLACSIYNKYGSEMLLSYGADTTVKNRDGLTPKELIKKNNFDFIIGL